MSQRDKMKRSRGPSVQRSAWSNNSTSTGLLRGSTLRPVLLSVTVTVAATTTSAAAAADDDKVHGRKLLEVMDMFIEHSDGFMVHTKPQTQQVADIKYIQLLVCQSYFKKAVFFQSKCCHESCNN